MRTDNHFQISSDQKPTRWGAAAAIAFLLLLSLGSLIYFFGVSLP